MKNNMLKGISNFFNPPSKDKNYEEVLRSRINAAVDRTNKLLEFLSEEKDETRQLQIRSEIDELGVEIRAITEELNKLEGKLTKFAKPPVLSEYDKLFFDEKQELSPEQLDKALKEGESPLATPKQKENAMAATLITMRLIQSVPDDRFIDKKTAKKVKAQIAKVFREK